MDSPDLNTLQSLSPDSLLDLVGDL